MSTYAVMTAANNIGHRVVLRVRTSDQCGWHTQIDLPPGFRGEILTEICTDARLYYVRAAAHCTHYNPSLLGVARCTTYVMHCTCTCVMCIPSTMYCNIDAYVYVRRCSVHRWTCMHAQLITYVYITFICHLYLI